MRHAAKNGYSVNAKERFHVCGCGHGYGIQIRIRNASAQEMHDQFTGVMLIHGFSPQVSRGRVLKSFRMLLDRRQRLVNELCIIQPLSIIMCLSFHNL